MSAEVLAKKKRIRAGHRASATRMITQTETLLSEETPNVVKLSQSKLSLQEKLETIKVLDGEMLELMEDEDLAEEVQQADGFKEGIYGAMIKIDKCVKMLCVHTPVTTSELRTPPAAHNKVNYQNLCCVHLTEILLHGRHFGSHLTLPFTKAEICQTLINLII